MSDAPGSHASPPAHTEPPRKRSAGRASSPVHVEPTGERAAAPSPSPAGLVELGRRLRARRRRLGLSVRGVAAAAGLSPSYVSALEAARNPTTGRPAAPSLRVLTAVAGALSLPAAELLDLAGPLTASLAACDHDHRLLYVRRPRPAPVIEAIDELYGDAVRRWLHIPDPREPVPDGRTDAVIAWPWPLGADPYPDRALEPARISAALRRGLERAAPELGDEPAGIVIGDCSAVMRWVVNPEDEIAFEARWAGEVSSIFAEVLGRPPAANVCVYHRDDLEALMPRIDAVGTAMTLLRHHDSIAMLDAAGTIRTGPAAAAAVLGDARPVGVSTHAWTQVAEAVARTTSVQ